MVYLTMPNVILADYPLYDEIRIAINLRNVVKWQVIFQKVDKNSRHLHKLPEDFLKLLTFCVLDVL